MCEATLEQYLSRVSSLPKTWAKCLALVLFNGNPQEDSKLLSTFHGFFPTVHEHFGCRLRSGSWAADGSGEALRLISGGRRKQEDALQELEKRLQVWLSLGYFASFKSFNFIRVGLVA